ncbi:hypothetical protein ALC62_10253 [Cyphomyrmex costatus]|uniref:RNase H type-1 domain-containing protein n=1 Tax=Cyphomyrmex costatus TaxID=456900 RepID=A0A151IE86_9HYME|nr:hypothetical protein ALC62_10253 [Cyphomyrmex costatus]
MIGSLESVFPAVQYNPLYTRRFERELFLALCASSGNYSRRMLIPSYLQEDFYWWLNIFSDTNQINPICTKSFACDSDASMTGWEAACDGQRTYGWWSSEDMTHHINVLELKAAFFALKCFARNYRGSNILLRIDNTTAIAYIANLFSAHSTRHASTSLAARKGLSLDLIKRAAGWSGDSQIFARFYNRTIVNPEAFCNSVLLS